MSKESLTSPYAKLIFRETFTDEQSVRKNGGVPTSVVFSQGKGAFDGSNSKINYNLNLNGTYSVRVRCKPSSLASSRLLMDFRGSNNNGVGYIFFYLTTGIVGVSSGTIYVNSLTSPIALNTSTYSEVILSGISLKEGSGANETVLGAQYSNSDKFIGDIELFEIYQGTLTASEVKNLYDNDWNKELTSSACLLDFNSTQGTIKDRTGLRTLTPTAVTVKRIGQKYSADFNGTTSLIDTGSDLIGTKAVTVCGWIYPRSIGEIEGRILDNGKTVLNVVTAGRFGFYSNAFTNIALSASFAWSNNNLKFILITRTATGVVNFYIGDLSNAPSLSGTANQNSGTPVAGTTNVIIGNNSDATRTFDGNISMLQIYEGILDLDTITNIWSESRNNFN